MALDAEARRALQAQARELGGLRVVGPSRVGLILPRLGLNAGGTTFLPPAGGLAFVSQSDALTTAMLDWAAARDIGFSLVAALGDSMDVELGDLLDLLALDLNTRAILLHLEGVSDARHFMSAGRAAARAKPVIVLRAGRYAGFGDGTLDPRRLLERDLAYEAAFARAGMLRVRTVEELFATAGTLASGIGLRRVQEGACGGRLAVVSNGGGPALLALDALVGGGGTPARLSPGRWARWRRSWGRRRAWRTRSTSGWRRDPTPSPRPCPGCSPTGTLTRCWSCSRRVPARCPSVTPRW
jgi:acetyltransferase